MSERDITAAVKTETQSDVVSLALFIKAEFPSGTVRCWTGVGDISWDSQMWTGLGDFLVFEPIVETRDTRANRVGVTVNGLSDDFFTPASVGDYQNNPASIWLGFFDSDMAVIADPYLIFSGIMESDRLIDDGETSALTIYANNRMADLLRQRIWRYTHEDQRTLHASDDKGLEFVAQLQDLEINWGKASNGSGAIARRPFR